MSRAPKLLENGARNALSAFEGSLIDPVGDVCAFKAMYVTTCDVSQSCANRRMRLPSGRLSKRLLHCQFEANARIKLEHIVDEGRRYFVHEQSEYVNMRPYVDKGSFGSFSVLDAGGRVECNPVPHQLGFRLRVVVRQKDATGSVGTDVSSVM